MRATHRRRGGAQYGGNLGQTAHGGTGANGGATLPFTGLDLGGVAGTGIVLIAAGIVLRRRTPARQLDERQTGANAVSTRVV